MSIARNGQKSANKISFHAKSKKLSQRFFLSISNYFLYHFTEDNRTLLSLPADTNKYKKCN